MKSGISATRMWPVLACCLLALASFVNADESGKVLTENIPDDSVSPDAGIPGLGDKLPTPEQLLKMLDSMSSISEADKASLREDLLRTIEQRNAQAQHAATAQPPEAAIPQSLVLLALVGLIVLIFVFFVFRLFRCLAEREAKREAKKNKQSKKNK